ncbi:hypothetical protein BP5796_02815 [Coleophoma crateriformis]|uniref:Xylanolytic transcriptional activator regulatory domain-containing protein n=1 Tax=Coleophoma crateriformis TaxID=565419 RepID=A0A3D8SZD9_9HELO|nr:hypothetical protein BP5796_02815 [Coleophoma crateriformis]
MFKFVAAEPGRSGQFTQKRQHAQRACEPCRKRKKRCHHHANIPTVPAGSSSISCSVSPGIVEPLPPSSPSSTSVLTPHPASERVILEDRHTMQEPVSKTSHSLREARSSHSSPSKVTELNPNPHSLEATAEDQGPEALGSRFIGDLSPAGVFLAATSPNTTRGLSVNNSVGIWLAKALNNAHADSLPQGLASQSPSSLFYGSSSVVQHVLIPVLEQECLGNLPPPKARDDLIKIYFDKVHPIFPIIDREVYSALEPQDPRRILLQQGLCLAASKHSAATDSLILQESRGLLTCRKFGEFILASMRMIIELCIVSDQLILIQALALMFQFNDEPDGGDFSSQLCLRAVHYSQTIGLHLKSQQCSSRDKSAARLFCCIWAIDKMNSAFHGRPVMMHERDFSRNLVECIQQQEAPFRLLLETTLLLDKIIDRYRPTQESEEDVMKDVFPTFEELAIRCGPYISTPILATLEILYHAVAILSCRCKGWETPQSSSASLLRQTLSTLRLTAATSRESREQLSLFPFVPYAVSLGLSISYRELRRNKIPLYRARARAQFQANCDILSDLKDIFWSASTMADMGKKVLKEIDRVVSTVATSDRGSHGDGTLPRDTGASHAESMDHVSQTNFPPRNDSFFPERTEAFEEFDASHFDSMQNIDVFGLFDPGFDLQEIDACLEGNLDPYMASQNRQTDFLEHYNENLHDPTWQSGWNP